MTRRGLRVASALAFALAVTNGRAVTAAAYPDGATVLKKAMDRMQYTLHAVHSQGTLSWESGTSPVRAIVSGDSRWNGHDADEQFQTNQSVAQRFVGHDCLPPAKPPR